MPCWPSEMRLAWVSPFRWESLARSIGRCFPESSKTTFKRTLPSITVTPAGPWLISMAIWSGLIRCFIPHPIRTAKSRTQTPSGVNFAIAAPLAKTVMEGLKKDGTIRRAYLGVELQTLTPGIAAMFSIPENVKGVVIALIIRDGPADKAGLKPKDVITALDGKTVKSSVELERTIIFSPPGKTVEMNLYPRRRKAICKGGSGGATAAKERRKIRGGVKIR